jgi:hypothetical protein
MAKTTPAKTGPSIRKFEEFPEHQAETQRLYGLIDRERELGRAIEAAENELRNTSAGQERVRREAALLLKGEKPTAKRPQETTRDLAELQHELQVVKEAIRMQKDTIARVESTLSKQICAELEPHFRELAVAHAKDVAQAALSGSLVASLLEELRNNRVISSLPSATFFWLDTRLTENLSVVASFFSDLVKQKVLTGKEEFLKQIPGL